MRRLTALVGAVALAAALSLPATARGNDPLGFRLAELGLSQPVDYLTWCGDCVGTDYTTGTPWVTNPTTCVWDVDDFYTFLSTGSTLAAGASVSVTACRYSPLWLQGGNHPAYAHILSSSPDLLVTVNYAWDGGSKSSQPVAPTQGSGNVWDYRACWMTPILPLSTPLVTVPGSNGGQAVYQSVTWTVVNPGRKATKTGGIIDADPRDIYLTCPHDIPQL